MNTQYLNEFISIFNLPPLSSPPSKTGAEHFSDRPNTGKGAKRNMWTEWTKREHVRYHNIWADTWFFLSGIYDLGVDALFPRTKTRPNLPWAETAKETMIVHRVRYGICRVETASIMESGGAREHCNVYARLDLKSRTNKTSQLTMFSSSQLLENGRFM